MVSCSECCCWWQASLLDSELFPKLSPPSHLILYQPQVNKNQILLKCSLYLYSSTWKEPELAYNRPDKSNLAPPKRSHKPAASSRQHFSNFTSPYPQPLEVPTAPRSLPQALSLFPFILFFTFSPQCSIYIVINWEYNVSTELHPILKDSLGILFC